MEIVSFSPWALTTSTLRVSGARASVRTGRDIAQGYRKRKGQPEGWPWTRGKKLQGFFDCAVAGLAGTISAEFDRTLGGLVALGAGECAPDVSSGFWSGGA